MRQHFEEQGLEAPADFFPPDLVPGVSMYVDAIDALAGDRPLSVGMGGVMYRRIPFLAIERYATRVLAIDDATEFARFHRIIAAADEKEVAAMNKAANKPT